MQRKRLCVPCWKNPKKGKSSCKAPCQKTWKERSRAPPPWREILQPLCMSWKLLWALAKLNKCMHYARMGWTEDQTCLSPICDPVGNVCKISMLIWAFGLVFPQNMGFQCPVQRCFIDEFNIVGFGVEFGWQDTYYIPQKNVTCHATMGCWSIVDRSLLTFTAFFSSIFCVGIRDLVTKPKVSSHIDKTKNQLLKISPKNSLPFKFFEVLNFLDI